jgi:hypothetical protein
MKNVMVMVLVLANLVSFSQDKEERIQRDIEVAENVLSTLIRQQMDRKSSFWVTEVRGSYTPGYGVTLRIPSDNFPFGFAFSTEDIHGTPDHGDVVIRSGNGNTAISRSRSREELDDNKSEKDKLKSRKAMERDSARAAYAEKLLQASKTFLADYGDLIGIEPNEKILITTKSERGGNYSYSFAGVVDIKMPKRRVLSVEAVKSELTQYKQNKISRDQLMAKFKVVNSELSDDAQPDLELISTIFSRLYRSDLSKTFFIEGAPYYERMNGFGVTYFMQVYSSNVGDFNRFNMPTCDLEGVDQATRDKKVKELYPIFEKDLKDNMLEYGRTINSLKDDELVIFDVTLTKCKGCGIPASIEVSVKASVLKDFGTGKISKDAALAKVNVKKGVAQ